MNALGPDVAVLLQGVGGWLLPHLIWCALRRLVTSLHVEQGPLVLFDASFNELLAVGKGPQGNVDHGDGGLWVAVTVSGFTARPVTNDGHDLQLLDRNLLDQFDQVSVGVELVVPVLLLVHHGPCRGGLVVGQDDAVFLDLLQVHGTADAHAANGCVDAFFNDVVIVFAMLQDAVNGRAKDGPDHV